MVLYTFEYLFINDQMSHRWVRFTPSYGGDSWALTKENNDILRNFENKDLRKVFGPLYDKEMQEWRRRHDRNGHVLCETALALLVNLGHTD